jgi:hypothetical protein
MATLGKLAHHDLAIDEILRASETDETDFQGDTFMIPVASCGYSGDRRGILAAAAFVFLAGTAGAGGVSWGVCGRFDGELASFCRGAIGVVEFAFMPLRAFVTGEAGIGHIEVVTEAFDAETALVLQFTKLGDRSVEDATGLEPGSVHRELDGQGCEVLHRIEVGIEDVVFDPGAAMKTPGGAGDFVGEGLLKDAFGREILPHGCREFIVFVGFSGVEDVAIGK